MDIVPSLVEPVSINLGSYGTLGGTYPIILSTGSRAGVMGRGIPFDYGVGGV